MPEQPRDWDKELAEIDKLMGKPGAAPAPRPAALPGGQGAAAPRPAAPAPPAAVSRRGITGAWARALAGAVLAGAMTQWPYAHACGGALLLYTLAAATVVVTGVWGGVATWRSRLAAAHVLSLVVTGWGIGLVAAVVLPRIGYAAEQLAWWCR